MQSRFTAKGVTKDEQGVILAYELKEDEFKVDLYIIPQKSLKPEQLEQLETTWVEGGAFDFPAEMVMVNPNLNAESILPDEYLSSETGKIRGKQNEWAYQLLTAKLWESYLHELDQLKNRAAELTQYDRQLFDDAKSFWERVLEHRKERDISQDRLDKIKDDVNSVFEKLKTFRKTETAEFEAASAKVRDEISAKLEALRGRADSNANFKVLLDELKALQQENRRNRYTKADDVLVKKIFDAAYQHINEQRNAFFTDKTSSRIKGLTEVVQKMETSLNRDKRDLEYLNKKSNSNNINQLELQLLKVKGNMLNEAIASKEEKLKDIYATLEKLQKQSSRGNKTTGTDKENTDKTETKTTTEKTTTTAEEAAHTDEPNPSQGE
jgi:chromosome segregation ATPase